MKSLVVVSLCLLSINAAAAATTLSDCLESTVQSAINSASDGDVLICPAGSWSWSNVNIINRDITLQGAGIDQTVISVTASGGIEATTSNTKPFRITGFTLRSTGNFGTDGGWAMIRILGGKGWRIDNNRIEIYSDEISWNGGNGIYTRYDVSGVIDNNTFVKGGGSGCMHAAVYPEGTGATAWGWGTQIGADNHTVFIEDNYFFNPDSCSSHNAHAVYGQNGGIYVARHNEIHGMNIDSHGFCSTHGTRESEISNNQWFGVGSTNLYSVLHMRGGTGVIYGNSWEGNITYAYWWEDYRAQGNSCGGTTFDVPGYGTVSASSPCPEGYPCAQQVGRGQNNGADPMYVWGNSGTLSTRNDASSYIQNGRDYFLNQGTKPGYVPYAYPHPLTVSGPRPNPPTALGVN